MFDCHYLLSAATGTVLLVLSIGSSERVVHRPW
jgi:hypothetical protein